jgi:hypothetical protein
VDRHSEVVIGYLDFREVIRGGGAAVCLKLPPGDILGFDTLAVVGDDRLCRLLPVAVFRAPADMVTLGPANQLFSHDRSDSYAPRHFYAEQAGFPHYSEGKYLGTLRFKATNFFIFEVL